MPTAIQFDPIRLPPQCEELRAEVRRPLEAFEGALLETIGQLMGTPPSPRVGAVVLSLLHVFDSEAVTVTVLPNPALEAARLEWAEQVLRGVLEEGEPTSKDKETSP